MDPEQEAKNARSDENNIRHELDVLRAGLAKQRELEAARAMRRALVQDTIAEQLAVIDRDFESELSALAQSIAENTKFVKTYVLIFGATVKGAGLMAIYSKGRMSWDDKRLDGYATAHPEILAFRSEGQPSVSIREV